MRNLGGICRNEAGMIDHFLGSAYDNVRIVAENIDNINLLTEPIITAITEAVELTSNARDEAVAAAEEAQTTLITKANASAIGITGAATNLGTFDEGIIPDDATAKEAMQALETDAVSRMFLSDAAATTGAGLIGFSHAATYAAGTDGKKGQQVRAVTDAPYSANAAGLADTLAAFNNAGAASRTVHVPAGVFNLSAAPNPSADVTWWVDKGASFTGAGRLPYLTDKIVSLGDYRSIASDTDFYDGIYGYLEQNAALAAYGTIGLHGAAQSLGQGLAPGTACIALSGIAIHNNVGSAGAAWGGYLTVLRADGVNGATNGLEIDVANMGSTVSLLPHAPFAAGQTQALWLCAGGETTEGGVNGEPGTASVALGIIRNDSQAVKTASFEKGILFGNAAILGADGTGSIGCAIAFAVGHAQQWYNNSGQVVAEIVATGTTFANMNMRLNFTDTGILLEDRASGAVALGIVPTASFDNGVLITPADAGGAPAISANGSDEDIDLLLSGKGAGLVKLGTYTAGALSATGYTTIKDTEGNIRRLLIG